MLLTMMWSACSSVEKEPQTLFHFEKMNEKSCKMSELMTDVEIIPLETNDDCLLDAQAKYLAHKGSIYASSMNEIFKFDEKGKFIGKLSRIGQGPGDYQSINDYEVVSRKGKLEIWIAHNIGISRYDAESFAYLGIIKTRSNIWSFTYISDETIIIKTADDYTFHLCNMEGTYRNAFLERDPANLSIMLLPFIEMDGRKFYCIEQTDEAVVYNEQTDSLELLKYASGNIDKLLTRKEIKNIWNDTAIWNKRKRWKKPLQDWSPSVVVEMQALLSCAHPRTKRCWFVEAMAMNGIRICSIQRQASKATCFRV